MDSVSTALLRFGLGPRPGDRDGVGDARAWLRRQIRPDAALPAGLRSLASHQERFREVSSMEFADVKQHVLKTYEEDRAARAATAYTTDAPFAERWVRHFSNHFTVSSSAQATMRVLGAYEREVVRPHAFGRFADMLLASCKHPAMLLYLDNTRSIGPDSSYAQARADGEAAGGNPRRSGGRANLKNDPRDPSRKYGGLNENLAREILELHTLGADGGYTQDDVRALANLITGWSVDQRAEAGAGFVFEAEWHQPGSVTLLGKTYGSTLDDGERAIRDLAAHPATARNVARRLARHFRVTDPASIGLLERAFVDSGGDLAALARALVDLDAAWSAPSVLATPDDWMTAMVRGSGIAELVSRDPSGEGSRGDGGRGRFRGRGGPSGMTMDGEGKAEGKTGGRPAIRRSPWVQALRDLGQQTWGAGSPEGWPDDEASWAGPEQLVRRIEVANRFALLAVGARSDALDRALSALGPSLTEEHRRSVERAGDRATALTLLFLAPEAMRR